MITRLVSLSGVLISDARLSELRSLERSKSQ
jgi:hypothetical protein